MKSTTPATYLRFHEGSRWVEWAAAVAAGRGWWSRPARFGICGFWVAGGGSMADGYRGMAGEAAVRIDGPRGGAVN